MSDAEISHETNGLPLEFWKGLATALVGYFVLFGLARDVLVPRCSTESFRKRFEALTTKKQNFFYGCFVSTVHHSAQSLFSMPVALGLSPKHNANRATYFDKGWPVYSHGILVGYMVADSIAQGPRNMGPAYCAHHLATVISFSWASWARAIQYYMLVCQSFEFTTIFYILRLWALQAGYPPDSWEVFTISLIFFGSFFVARILPLPFWVNAWVTTDAPRLDKEKGRAVAVVLSMGVALNVVLQSFWFFLMVKKLVKTMTAPSSTKSPSKGQESHAATKEE